MNDALFDLGDEPSSSGLSEPAPAREEQLASIRRLFDLAEITDQQDRREFVRSTVLSDVASLRALTALQARRVIDRLKASQNSSSRAGGSLWDTRDEDTWIDKL